MDLIRTYGSDSIEQQLLLMDSTTREKVLDQFSQELTDSFPGVDPTAIVADAKRYGNHFESIRSAYSEFIPTGMNCLMALLASREDLLELEPKEFERLAGSVGKVSLAARNTNLYTYEYATPFRGFTVINLLEGLRIANNRLGQLGVDVSVSLIHYGASAYGNRYEDARYPAGGTVTTSMNCMMALLHNQPSLMQLPDSNFFELGKAVSGMSMITREIVHILKDFSWPDIYMDSPLAKDSEDLLGIE
jgi:hypothetical protein